jgi:branched-chain amino acid aminotransferase
LHYGQSIFEGMKAYKQKDGSVAAFRVDLHAARFKKSAEKMAMSSLPEDVFTKCVMEFVKFEQESVPGEPDHSLYLRPLLFAKDEIVKLGPGTKYTFYVMGTIAGKYFAASGITPAKVLVNKQYVRAFPGGTGEAKTAGNYAASLSPQAHAISLGCDQVLYLDANQHDNIDELGGMNFFMIRGKDLVTPALSGAILNGVTRRSILEMATTWGLNPKEETISFTQLVDDIRSGKVTECFACGTAAVVHPIGTFVVEEKVGGERFEVQLPKEFPLGIKILDTLQQVQRGQLPAPGNWIFKA